MIVQILTMAGTKMGRIILFCCFIEEVFAQKLFMRYMFGIAKYAVRQQQVMC
jgi:hypothetical protein